MAQNLNLASTEDPILDRHTLGHAYQEHSDSYVPLNEADQMDHHNLRKIKSYEEYNQFMEEVHLEEQYNLDYDAKSYSAKESLYEEEINAEYQEIVRDMIAEEGTADLLADDPISESEAE